MSGLGPTPSRVGPDQRGILYPTRNSSISVLSSHLVDDLKELTRTRDLGTFYAQIEHKLLEILRVKNTNFNDPVFRSTNFDSLEARFPVGFNV